MILEGLERVGRRGTPPGDPGAAGRFELFPAQGASPEALLHELDRLAADAADVHGPGWMGHMDPPPVWSSILGAAASALLNNNLLMEELSPSFTHLEKEVVSAFAAELGFGDAATGTLTAGGSLANLLALAAARNDRLARCEREGEARSEALARLSVVTSEDAHTSIGKAVGLLGLDPTDGLLSVPAGPDGAVDASRLAEVVEAAERRGRCCFCIVATAGTTVLGAIDPLAEVAVAARRHGAWYHVDAAYAGPLAFLPERRAALLQGLEEADSVIINPQKWLYVAKVCALVLFQDGARARSGLDWPVPYAQPHHEGGTAGSINLEGTRHADVLKLRLALLQMGRASYSALVDRSFALTELLAAEVAARPFLELAARPATNIVVFRWRGDADSRTTRLQRWLLDRAGIFLSLPTYRGQRWLRAVLLNPLTNEDTIRSLFACVDAFAASEA